MNTSPESHSRSDVAERLLRWLSVHTGADMAYFHLGDDLRVVTGADPEFDWTADADYWRDWSWRDLPIEAAYAAHEPFVFHRSASDEFSARALAEAPTPAGTVLAIPLADSSGEVLGGLDLLSIAERSWSDAEIRAARTVTRTLLLWFDWQAGLGSQSRRIKADARRSEALSTCASLLLSGRGDATLQAALDALMEATDAELGFVERNVLSGDDLASHTVCFSSPGTEEFERERWELVSWERMPECRLALEEGRPYALRTDFLQGPEAEVYDGSWVASEIDVPIFVNGEWAGLIGFADALPERRWDADLPVLELAASMIGAFWANQEVEADVERRAARERALRECARILLSGEEHALDDALAALVQATSAACCFVEQNTWDPELGLVSELVTVVPLDNGVYDPGHWDRRPWSTMPDSFARLSKGQVFALVATELGPIEAKTYAESGVGAEIDAPIMVRGQWRGLLAIAVAEPRQWAPEEVELVATAATLIGAYWERQESMDELREVVRSKDRFLASVSHEVRTPLTAVVGLAEILRSILADHPDDQVRELVGLIAEQGFEMANIIEDLLVAGRMEIDAVSVVGETVDILDQIDLALRGVNGAERVVVERTPCKAVADPVRFRQIVRNLVTNALRYGGETVLVSIAESVTHATVSVGDNGVGVRAADVERIFEPYERAGDAPSSAGSVGIGLAVSRHLARKMGGDLVYRRKPGWTWFELSLPVLSDD